MIENITFAIRNKKTKKEKELIGLGIKKENIISFTSIDDLMGAKIKTDYVFTLDENSVLNENFIDIISEYELDDKTVNVSLITITNDNDDVVFFNKTPLVMNGYSSLVNYVEMTTLGLIIPKKVLLDKEYVANKELSFYKDLNFYLFLIKAEIDVQINGKVLFSLKTNEYDYNSFDKEVLDNELKKLVNDKE